MLGTKVLEEKLSRHNGKLRVVRSWGLGIYIQSNGLTQSGGVVDAIWRKTLRKIKTKKRHLEKVLILGLGGGSAAGSIRKLWKDCKIIGVDIDSLIVEMGKKYLRLNKHNVDIQISDAKSFRGKYDLILVDLYNGDKYPTKFEKENFLIKVRKGLNPKGVAVFNRLYFGEKKHDAKKFGNSLGKVFKNVELFYPEANLVFICYNRSA